MKIVCDEHIPFLVEAVRREWQEVEICPMKPEEMDASAVREADVLVVRTRTRVNEALLSGSRVRLVCTATIGYDHIDTAWCEAHGVRWMSCPGCNAQAVCDYVEEALEELSAVSHQPSAVSRRLSELTIGVVGVGHVGSLVARMARRRGMNVLLNDPPKGIGGPLSFIAQNSDIVTFHTPLTKDGTYATYHLCDEAFLSRCKPGAVIINAARGGVVDEQALLRSGHPYIIDTWENEPFPDEKVLSCAFRASMHIAGYSIAGKRNASQMCLDAIAEKYRLDRINTAMYPYSGREGDTSSGWLERITVTLKAQPGQFETLRKSYPLRGVQVR